MVAIRGHFDGKVFVPEEPVAFPVGQRLIMRMEPVGATGVDAIGVSGKSLLRFAGLIDSISLGEMEAAIEEGCERVDHNEW
jgi:hypothetical protein